MKGCSGFFGRFHAGPFRTCRPSAKHKTNKHADNVKALGRLFIPFVGDVGGGIGPPVFYYWLRDVFAEADRMKRAAGDDGHTARDAFATCLCELLAVLVRSNCKMLDDLTRDRR